MRTADAETAAEYVSLGEKIETVRRGIIEKAENGEIYDIFICFKATEIGSDKKTDDYYLGRDIYYDLTKDGYRVFFSAETLKRTAEQEFEPYIFRALSTARVMLVLCSDNEKIESAWVKNEWSGFLDMRDGKGLIPVCGNDSERYSPYSLPDELRKLNAIEYDGKLFENLKMKIEAYFPERIKAREDAEKKAKEAEYEARYAKEREAQALLLKKQQEQLEALMRKLEEKNGDDSAKTAERPDEAAASDNGQSVTTAPEKENAEAFADKPQVSAKAKAADKTADSPKKTSKPAKAAQKAESLPTVKADTVDKAAAAPEPRKSTEKQSDPLPEAKDLVMVIDNGVLKSIKVKNQSDPFSVTLPEYVKRIERNAFSDCKCSAVTLPSGLKEIESRAFEDCKTLRSISISDSVAYIAPGAFDGCNLLTEIRVSDDNKNYRSVNGDLYSKDGKN